MIVRLMPHEVADLEPVLLMLSKQDIKDLQVMQLICMGHYTTTGVTKCGHVFFCYK